MPSRRLPSRFDKDLNEEDTSGKNSGQSTRSQSTESHSKNLGRSVSPHESLAVEPEPEKQRKALINNPKVPVINPRGNSIFANI